MAGVPASALTGVACVAMATAGLAVGATASVRPDATAVAVIFPPWWASGAAFTAAAANGRVVQLGASPAILMVRSDSQGLPGRLRAAGALLILDPRVAGGCVSNKDNRHG